MTRASTADYFINVQAWKQNGTHFGIGYAVKDTTNLTDAGSIVLLFDTSVVAGKQTLTVDTVYGSIVNNTLTQITVAAYFVANGIIAGVNSFNFPSTELPKFSMHPSTYAVSSAATTTQFLNITLLNVRQRNCAANAYVFETGTCESACPAKTWQVYSSTPGASYCEACMAPCATCSFPDICDSCPNGYLALYVGICSRAAGKYSNLTTSTCELCHATCLTCFGGNSSQCSSCSPGLMLSAGVCSCPAYGQFYDSSSHLCSRSPWRLPELLG